MLEARDGNMEAEMSPAAKEKAKREAQVSSQRVENDGQRRKKFEKKSHEPDCRPVAHQNAS